MERTLILLTFREEVTRGMSPLRTLVWILLEQSHVYGQLPGSAALSGLSCALRSYHTSRGGQYDEECNP